MTDEKFEEVWKTLVSRDNKLEYIPDTIGRPFETIIIKEKNTSKEIFKIQHYMDLREFISISNTAGEIGRKYSNDSDYNDTYLALLDDGKRFIRENIHNNAVVKKRSNKDMKKLEAMPLEEVFEESSRFIERYIDFLADAVTETTVPNFVETKIKTLATSKWPQHAGNFCGLAFSELLKKVSMIGREACTYYADLERNFYRRNPHLQKFGDYDYISNSFGQQFSPLQNREDTTQVRAPRRSESKVTMPCTDIAHYDEVMKKIWMKLYRL